MSFANEYRKLCLVTESPVDGNLAQRLVEQARAIHGFLGLLTESGEFADKFKRHVFYAAPLDMTNSAEEVGDIMWYISILLDHIGIDWEQCMLANIAKLKKRYGDKYAHHAALNRDLEGERRTLEDKLGHPPLNPDKQGYETIREGSTNFIPRRQEEPND